MSEHIFKQTFKNISYNALGKVLSFAFQSFASVVLSRELVAADYGVAGFAMIWVTFMKSFSGFGINKAAIRSERFSEAAADTAFTLRQIVGIIAFAVTIAGAEAARLFFPHPAIATVIRVLAWAVLIDNFSLVSTIYLERELRYGALSTAETALTVASSLTAVCLVYNGFTYWSIVYAYLAANLTFVVVAFSFRPYRPRFRLDAGIAREYLKYGSTVFLTGLLTFVLYNFDNFVIGAVAGAERLGFYAIAFNWGAMVCSVMGAVVFGVLFPTFARLQHDPAQMKTAYLKILQLAAFVSVLCNIGLLCVGENFLVTVLGKGADKWLPSLVALRILCLYGVVRSLIEPAASYLMALNRAETALKATMLVAAVELSLVYPAVRFSGIEAVATVVLLSFSCQLLVLLPALRRASGILLHELWRAVRPAVFAGTTMAGLYFSVARYLPHGPFTLAVSIVLLTAAYLVAYGALTGWQDYARLLCQVQRPEA